MEENSQLIGRIATFFLLLGIMLMIIFIGSVLAKQTAFLFFLLSASASFVSYLLYRRAPKPPPSDRFSGLRKARERRLKRLEEKRQKQQQKKK
jgi:Na+-transporting methylmalonyl-CoA/oxaloacetate decarboxylase gamma subunit